jgi:HD-like signal output (HDOD) protein
MVPIERLASLVERDQGLVARVLRLGRSAMYAGTRKPTDVRAVISNIGLGQLHAIVEMVWANDCFQVHEARCQQLSGRLARFALARALAMRALAEATGGDPSTAYVAGLLADIGASFLVWVMAEKGSEQEADPDGVTKLVVGHHEEIGGRLLRHWGHDDDLVRLAQRHHGRAADEVRGRLPDQTVIACAIAQELTGEPDVTGDGDQDAGRAAAAAARLGLGPPVIRDLGHRLRREFGSMLELLKP